MCEGGESRMFVLDGRGCMREGNGGCLCWMREGCVKEICQEIDI